MTKKREVICLHVLMNHNLHLGFCLQTDFISYFTMRRLSHRYHPLIFFYPF